MKKRMNIILTILFLLILIIGIGLSIFYSIKIQSEGDVLFKNKNYKVALVKYQVAKKLWLFEYINIKINGIDISSKINNTKKIIESDDNFIKGMEAYKKKDDSKAKYYLTRIDKGNSHFSEVQKLLVMDNKEIQVVIDGKIPVFLAGSNRWYKCQFKGADEIRNANKNVVDSINKREQCTGGIWKISNNCQEDCYKKSSNDEEISKCKASCAPKQDPETTCKTFVNNVNDIFKNFYKLFYNICDGSY